MCYFLQVSRSSYYEWLNPTRTDRGKEDKELTDMIKKIFAESRKTYGSRRIRSKLAQLGKFVGRKRVARLMRAAHLYCKTKRRFKVTTNSNHNKPISPNLLQRQFKVSKPDQYWVGDITYIPTSKGWLYLATVIDLYSRQVVGWSMSNRMQATLVNDALLMAIWKRKPAKGLIWHTDRGSQYASKSHREVLKDHHIIQSMSRKGDCWDNAVAESFFHTLKTELTHHQKFKDREEAKHVIFEYIEVFYNRIRIHSANNYMSPVDFEQIGKVA
jgi:transposase InsO family protein